MKALSSHGSLLTDDYRSYRVGPLRPACLTFNHDLQQVGSNVVANGSGAFNLSGVTGEGDIGGGSSGVRASIGLLAYIQWVVCYPLTVDSPD